MNSIQHAHCSSKWKMRKRTQHTWCIYMISPMFFCKEHSNIKLYFLIDEKRYEEKKVLWFVIKRWSISFNGTFIVWKETFKFLKIFYVLLKVMQILGIKWPHESRMKKVIKWPPISKMYALDSLFIWATNILYFYY